MMLGASRPTVTLVAGTLQKAGLITYRRGRVTIVDREELERNAHANKLDAALVAGLIRQESSFNPRGDPSMSSPSEASVLCEG